MDKVKLNKRVDLVMDWLQFVNSILALLVILFFLIGPSFIPGFFQNGTPTEVFRFGFLFGLTSPYFAWCVYTDYRKLVRRA